ncbi:MAG: hypothetical protein QGI65_08430 [SAR324 cluster bacterium]|nr:hypothetical protein [SAR324 cluster bacterium]MDP6521546.1 hypothetical protein [SAR324 cluster bacterium]
MQSFLLPVLIFITLCIAAPAAVSQETTDSDLSQSLEEDPFAEIDPELGLDEDPLSESDPELGLDEDSLSESDPELGTDEDPLAESDPKLRTDEDPLVETSKKFGSERDLLEEASPELGIEKDPLAEFDPEQVFKEDPLQKASPGLGSSEDQVSENDGALGLNEDPFSGESSGSDQQEVLEFEEETPEGDDMLQEEEEFNVKVNFSHKVKTLLGASKTVGLSVLEPLLSEIKEFRFVSTYDQSVKIHTSPRMYNYFRLSISFSQNYEVNKKRLFDGYATLREIYSNYRTGPHQLRYGTQIFSLGKVDLDKVIDVLHMNNIMGLYTFDPDDTKDSLTSIRYNWFRGGHTATLYIAPIRQQSFGMRFTEFREGIEEQETDSEDSRVSFLRDYYGLQYQWTGDIVDTRLGLFHWFDANPYIKFEYEGASETDTAAVRESFENMLGNYTEKETRSDFITFELDAIWTDMVWKLESGLFKKRNFYSYEIPQERQVKLSTFQSPHFALATSFERTFPYFYWLMIYSHRKSYDVPENTHVFLYENEDSLIQRTRDVERNQVSGVAVLKTPDNSLRITLLNYRTWPFVQNGFASLFTWEHYKENLELELKFFSLKTDRQKMLNNQISTNQVFLTYTQKFAAN